MSDEVVKLPHQLSKQHQSPKSSKKKIAKVPQLELNNRKDESSIEAKRVESDEAGFLKKVEKTG